MKATGIVRGIDDLGRFVIPMEIRRTFNINVGDSLEVFTDSEGHIILRKYDPLPEISSRVDVLKKMITENTNYSSDVTKKALRLLTDLESLIKNADDEK
jgi:AbrB family transcriptional regulator (stage V sporulation protein T)